MASWEGRGSNGQGGSGIWKMLWGGGAELWGSLGFCFFAFVVFFLSFFFLLQIFKHERDQKRKDVSVKLNYNSIRQSMLSN